MQIAGREVRGFLIDLDGVLHVGRAAIAGAIEKVNELERRQIPHCFVTNTTTRSRTALTVELNQLGFAVKPDSLVTAPAAAVAYLERRGRPRCKLLLAPDVAEEFSHLPRSESEAEVVVVGDIGPTWSYPVLNQVFQLLVGGAELVALHKNRFWQTDEGLQLDIGAFVVALEYASGKVARLIGKPNEDFFAAALERLGVQAEAVAMIGDDIDSDVGGAQRQGMLGIQVKTGKYRDEYAARSEVRPDLVLPSIAALELE